jgi:GNAT superfamily N-acetyltransferase
VNDPHLTDSTATSLSECLAFDHLAVDGDRERRHELTLASQEGRMRVALVGGRAVGYTILAPWFFGVSFLELLYVDPPFRRTGVGRRLLGDFEARFGPQAFTSTNASNAAMRRLLTRRGWIASGTLHGLDEDDPEVFFRYRRA